jgi:hypothetical protein
MSEGHSAPDAYGVNSYRRYERIEMKSRSTGEAYQWADVEAGVPARGVVQVDGELFLMTDWTMTVTERVGAPR